jgi:putative FmdB family regulatory protein
MPTYEYKCTNGHTFEAVQGMTEAPLSRCPKCKASVRRVINGGMGIIFKGSGFYTTDYKKSSSLTGANSKKSEGSSSEGKGSGSSEGSRESSREGPKESSKDKGSSEKGSKEKAAAS